MDTTPIARPFVRSPTAGSIVNVLGTIHTYKATANETAGAISLWEAEFPPGAATPPHTHSREDEIFYVLSGELLIDVEGDPAPHRVGPGGFFFGARGRCHAVRNLRDQPARAVIMCTPSCGLDQMFVEIEAATADGMPTVETLAGITAKYGVALGKPA